MIKSFKGRHTEALFRRQPTKKFGPDVQKMARRKLLMVDSAVQIEELRSPPGNRLEELKGDRLGQWSIRVNDQWRICFVWRDDGVYDVELVDYH